MKLSIRMKIFLPVVILLIGFPLATWATLRYSLEVHMNFNARRDLEAMVRTVDGVLEEPEDGEEGDTVLSRLRDAVQTGAGEARMLVVSEKYRVVYPKNFDDQADMSQIYSAFLNAATDDESVWEQDKILEETIEEKEYLLYYKYVTPSEREKDQKVRHILLYCPVHDTTAMMDQITRVVLLTMSVIAAAAIALFWLVAGSISVPVQRLCEAARGIGEKKFKRVETGATVKELCELEGEINHMQEKLAQADQAERTFFQNASHELRTPVAVITSQAEYSLLPDATPEEQREGLEVILEQAQKMSALISQLLMLARADSGTQQLTMAPVDLSLLASMTAEQCREAAARRQIRLDCEIAPGIMTEGDQASLVRVFLNLLENAIQYGRPGGFVKLTLAVQNDFAVCSIADDGIGIARENLERIWQRFYRVDPSRNPGGSNTGLGLSLVKWIIEAHHGTIEAESGLGKGSCFTFRLPLQPPAKKAPQG